MKSRGLFQRAKKYLVAGVSSPVRAFGYVGGSPLFIESGKGSRVRDYDGREYIDYVLSWGSLILGHADKKVQAGIKDALRKGVSLGTTGGNEVNLARRISEAIPCIEQIRFTNSGTEAVMGAVRLARGYTGRSKIIKFAHAYHGHADYFLSKAGSGLATFGIPISSGVPQNLLKDTITLPLNDREKIEQVFERYSNEVAAVIVEPVGANHGVIPADAAFLKYLRKKTIEFGTLLIADEVITGFRFYCGALSLRLGVRPDIICLGKIIGGGLPVGAYGAREVIMRHLAPLGKVYQASTFSGNHLVMAAGLATLNHLKKTKKEYDRINALTQDLCQAIEKYARSGGVSLKASRFGSLFSLKFLRKEDFVCFYRALLSNGVFFAPSEFESNFLSFAHTREDIEKTKEAAFSALESLSKRNGHGRKKH